MPRSAEQLRRDALRIWRAAVDAVRSERLVADTIGVEGARLRIGDESFDLAAIDRIAVVGAGKAGAGMAAAVEEALGPTLLREKRVTGWVNVPADCVRAPSAIHLHPAGPPASTSPPPPASKVPAESWRSSNRSAPDDLCLCLISGGGSALLPAPVEAITLDDKLALTRHLSAAGANIEQLNAVRKQLSRIKGGGLARACRARWMATLIISDVLGDPLDVIASGPTVPDSSTPAQALEVLRAFAAREAGISPRVFEYLESRIAARPAAAPAMRVVHRVIGNNAVAVDAAGLEAVRLGYSPALHSAQASEGPAEEMGIHLAEMARSMRGQRGPDCLVSGGEPVVKLVPAAERGLGGRNQQLVLAALTRLEPQGAEGIVVLSGGTDGEDGPTDAAGAWLDASVLTAARQRGLDPAAFLGRNDAYRFFEPLGVLIRTGPTHTNVCDVRVVLVDRVETPGPPR